LNWFNVVYQSSYVRQCLSDLL